MNVRILFDCGSQRLYASQEIKESLSLQSKSKETMIIELFGSTHDEMRHCDIIRLTLVLKNGQGLELPFLTTSLMCDPLESVPLGFAVESLPHLYGVDLADSTNSGSLPIEMLIGSDYYWRLVTGRVLQHKDAPAAVEMHLGWAPLAIP